MFVERNGVVAHRFYCAFIIYILRVCLFDLCLRVWVRRLECLCFLVFLLRDPPNLLPKVRVPGGAPEPPPPG